MSNEERIVRALGIAQTFGMNDGADHKMWVIDQMVRALTGCGVLKGVAHDQLGQYTTVTQGESAEYRAWVAATEAGEDGPKTYEWDVGIAP